VDTHGCFDRYRQPCRRTERGVVHETASPEFRYRQRGGFEQRRGRDLHGVHDPLAIGEGHAAGLGIGHESSIGEEKEKIKLAGLPLPPPCVDDRI
jgi:hypothetical protein